MATLTPTADCTFRDQEWMRAADCCFDGQLALVKPWLRKRVLETVRGLGRFTRSILDRELVVGLDGEADCVALHRQNHLDYQNVVALEVEASNPPSIEVLRSNHRDTVDSLNVLEYQEGDRQALRNLWQILPDGRRHRFSFHSTSLVELCRIFQMVGQLPLVQEDRTVRSPDRHLRESHRPLASSAGKRRSSPRGAECFYCFGETSRPIANV